MATETACRRCSECEGSEHHWMEDDGPCTADGNLWPCWACKHCEAVGADCPRCRGDEAVQANCLRCEGDGVVAATAFLCDGQAIVESGPHEAARAYETTRGRWPDSTTSASIAGRCEGCYGLLVEGTDYLTDRDGDGLYCRECGGDGEPADDDDESEDSES